ncbi:hypothetical protein EYR36_005090 [Pleurotus pulmonarius]|nr:hypothetical protein EYR36_005090 [Pleurotus pulmonarius]
MASHSSGPAPPYDYAHASDRHVYAGPMYGGNIGGDHNTNTIRGGGGIEGQLDIVERLVPVKDDVSYNRAYGQLLELRRQIEVANMRCGALEAHVQSYAANRETCGSKSR